MPEPESLYDSELMWELLGLMMWSPHVIAEVGREVDPEDFGEGSCRKVYTVIMNLYLRGAEVDPFMVREDLEDDQLMLDVLNCTRDTLAVPGNAAFYARKIHALGLLRRVRGIGADLVGVDANDDPNEAIAQATDILRAAGETVTSGTRGIVEIIAGIEDEIDAGGAADVVATGIPQLDFLLDGGLHPKRLYILGARPGVGKSALAANIARLALDAGQRTLFMSLEMTEREVMTRMIGDKYEVDHSDVAGLLEGWNSPEVAAWPLHFTEVSDITKMASQAYLLHGQGLRLIIVDYIQLLTTSERFDRRDLEIGYFTRMLKRLSMELGVAVLGVSQVNRGADDRPPGLANLRESGNLEADANVCLLLHRKLQDYHHRNETTLAVAKNRHGMEGSVELRFMPTYVRFRSQVDLP